MRHKPRDRKIDRLRDTELLRGATSQQLLAVAQLADETTSPAGTVLAREGRHPQEVLLVVEGAAARYRYGQRTAAESCIVGREAHAAGRPYDHTVIAESEVRLLAADPRNYAALLAAIPSLQHGAEAASALFPVPALVSAPASQTSICLLRPPTVERGGTDRAVPRRAAKPRRNPETVRSERTVFSRPSAPPGMSSARTNQRR